MSPSTLIKRPILFAWYFSIISCIIVSENSQTYMTAPKTGPSINAPDCKNWSHAFALTSSSLGTISGTTACTAGVWNTSPIARSPVKGSKSTPAVYLPEKRAKTADILRYLQLLYHWWVKACRQPPNNWKLYRYTANQRNCLTGYHNQKLLFPSIISI